MQREEFKQKMNEIKKQLKDILCGIECHDAYIYKQLYFRNFHSQVQEQ